MKKIALIFILGVLTMSTSAIQAQSTAPGTIQTEEKKVEKVTHKEMEYHIIDGIWYLKVKERYILKRAPKGAKLKHLPKEGENVVMGGKKYYKLNGVFYKKIKSGLWEVARP